MPKTHPIEIRERVVAHVEEGHSHRSTAARFQVSIKFVNDMIKLKRETGRLLPRSFAVRKGCGKLEPHKDWLRARVDAKGDITLDELAVELKEQLGVDVHRWTVCRMLHQLGLSHKKRQYGQVSSAAKTSNKSVISG